MHLLGVDVGTTHTKVALVEMSADEAPAREVRIVSADTSDDVDALLATVLRLVTEVLEDAPPVEAVGIASMAETGVPLGADDRPLSPLLRWDAGHRGAADQAARHAGELVQALVRTFGHDELFAATGVRPAAKSPLVTWLRLASDEPELWSRLHRWAGAADLVALALTGRLVTDHTLAGRTLAYPLPGVGETLPDGFAPELLAIAGLRPEQLPSVRLPGAAPLTVVAGPFADAGLRVGTPVLLAGHDHQVGAWAAGVRAPGQVADSVGTAESVITLLPDSAVVDRAAVARDGMSLVRTVDDATALVAGSATAGAVAWWWLERAADHLDRETLLATVVAEPPQPGGAFVLPYLAGRQSPWPDPAATLLGVDADDIPGPLERFDTADLVLEGTRAVYAGLCLQARWMWSEQRRLVAVPRGPLTLIGGRGVRGPLTITKAQVHPGGLARVLATEPVATGAALLAAVRAGLVGPDSALLEVSTDPEPDGDPWAGDMDRFRRAALHAETP